MALKAERQAEVIWEGTLARGKGVLNGRSGALSNLPLTWASRVERSDGRTSPEELIAAAHAGCYAMAFSNTLEQNGTPPERLQVTATCTIEEVAGAPKITTIALNAVGRVPGLDNAGFASVAKQAEQGCPVSNALRNNVAIQVNASLEQ
jgi:osmotically inducible protein OsmC